VTTQKLTIDDIADARAYERERDELRRRIIAMKKVRRVPVGPIISFVFENRDTIRFQVQEMARVERLFTDEAVQAELDTYNPLIPGGGALSASMFIELTSRAGMDEWLRRLVGVERSAALIIGQGRHEERIPGCVDDDHAGQLTRVEVTAAVHFVHFTLIPSQIDRFEREEVRLSVDHPAYHESTILSAAAKASLLGELLG
jgi:Protein of unknown function (DUF3501)